MGVLLAIAALAVTRLLPSPSALPPGFASGNGRIEATQVDVATKLPGRLAAVLVREGDVVAPGQLLARMNTDELDAQRRAAEAQERQAVESRHVAEALVVQREAELAFTRAAAGRTRTLAGTGAATREQLDRDVTAERTADAALAAARTQVVAAEASIGAAHATVERIAADVADAHLTSPLGGRVLYRLAEPGEVLPAGGKVLTVLDLSDVYMTIFLPTEQAGRASVGAEARIVLDALPEHVLPATVSYVAAESQFTPKAVETRTEREKLMFRVKLALDPALLRAWRDRVQTGVPGDAVVRLDPAAPWPERLRTRLPDA